MIMKYSDVMDIIPIIMLSMYVWPYLPTPCVCHSYFSFRRHSPISHSIPSSMLHPPIPFHLPVDLKMIH